MASKLNKISTQYNTFKDDQVLTANQLNSFINYFEEQDRMSRVFLNGVGIICGFKIKKVSDKSITITNGIGVTTDGDLIALREPVGGDSNKSIQIKEVTFRHYLKFDDKSANYDLFKRDNETIELWELLPESIENSFSLETMSDLKDKTVILYLEDYINGGNLCTTIDCDNQGEEQIARLRVLLVSKKDADYIVKEDKMYSKYDAVHKFIQMPELNIRRVILNQHNTTSFELISKEFFKAINSDDLINNLISGIDSFYTNFANLLQLESFKSQFEKFPYSLKKLVDFIPSNIPVDIQYRYDLVKDIILTWNEIRNSLFKMAGECLPDTDSFPKHLMIGNIDEADSNPKQNRHSFYRSPALTLGVDRIKECHSLLHRLFEMVNSYNFFTGEVKLTPSYDTHNLSSTSIPFYYNVSEKLLKVWDYAKSEKYNYTNNLSYHRKNLSQLPQIQEPLDFSIDRFNFIRIEGHQGKEYKDALNEILYKRNKYGLPFDVKSLSINVNTENLNVDDFECEFEDLNTLLRAWTAEQNCVLAETSKLLSGFSIADPGKNIAENMVNSEIYLNPRTIRFTEPVNFNLHNDSIKYSESSYGKDNSYKTYNLKSNIIADNLITEEKSLGNIFKEALVKSENGSVNDIIAESNKMIRKDVDKKTWDKQPDMKEFAIDQSVELMAYSHILSREMPYRISELSFEKVNRYKLTLKELCNRVDKMKVQYQKINLSPEMKAIMNVLINHLSGICCSSKKLEILLEEINKRKEAILVNLRLSEFVKQHPGLEHRAGVVPGGTFVIVYLNKNQRATSRDAAPSLSENDRDKSSNIPAADAKTPGNRVVADFYLPYICCSDCTPVNFIIQKPPVWFRLERDYICLGDLNEVRYDVSPENGEVKSVPDIKGMSISKGKIIFDPKKIMPETIGIPIHFTVNQQVTDEILTLYKVPEVNFRVLESPEKENEITFVPTGEIDGARLYWDFGDGTPVSEEEKPTHLYKLPVNDKNLVTVTLKVRTSNSVCVSTVSHDIQFKEIIQDNCFETTSELITDDLKYVLKYNLPNNNNVTPIWVSTSEIYGGTTDYSHGVLDDLENFLSGKHNENLPEMFEELLMKTSTMILELSDRPTTKEYKFTVQLFILQLKLLYNILGCQDKEAIEKSKSILSRLFKMILTFLKRIKDKDIKLPEDLPDFVKLWSVKVEGKQMLEEHAKKISELLSSS